MVYYAISYNYKILDQVTKIMGWLKLEVIT